MLKRFFKKKEPTAKKIETIVKKSVRNGAKDILTGNDSLTIDGKHKLIKQEINNKAREILKGAINEPEILLEFIKSKGTIIVKSKHMDKILFFFGDTAGFLPPKSGINALLLSFVINLFSSVKIKPGFNTPPMFALNSEPVNIYTLAHQFHLWLSYTNRLPGFDEKTMSLFKYFWKEEQDSTDFSKLSVDEMFSLKDIIAREVEALNFVKELGREIVGSKETHKKLKDGKSVNM